MNHPKSASQGYIFSIACLEIIPPEILQPTNQVLFNQVYDFDFVTFLRTQPV